MTTRVEALRKLLARPRDHVDQGRIGRVQKYATPDGREKLNFTVRVLRCVVRRTA